MRWDWNYLLLAIIWLAGILWVAPWAEIPLIDDWVYAYPIFSLSGGNDFSFPMGTGPNALLQISIGILIANIAGSFSFVTLRILALTLSLLGSLLLYEILLKWDVPRLAAWWGVLLWMACPIYFFLSFTFMTEVPFLTMCLLSILGWLFYLRREHWFYLFLALAGAFLALLNRQFGLMLFFSMAISLGISHSRNPGKKWIASGIALSGLTAYFFIEIVIKDIFLQTAPYLDAATTLQYRIFHGPETFVQSILKRSMACGLYLGVWSIPLLPLFVPTLLRRKRAPLQLVIITILALFLSGLTFSGEAFSQGRGNIFYNLGLGPMTLHDGLGVNTAEVPYLPPAFEWGLSFLGLWTAGGILLLFLGSKESRRHWQNDMGYFLIPMIVLSAATIFLPNTFFDRYLLLPLLSIYILVLKSSGMASPLSQVITGVVALGLLIFSTTATKDYFSWQNARWALFRQATDLGIPGEVIDGGYELNGWQTALHRSEKLPLDDPSDSPRHQYFITFSKMPGYETEMAMPYRRRLFQCTDTLFLVRRPHIKQDKIK